ncbi:MAG: hypothetical protein OYH76_03685 [Defluviicoccus sp.]|nr:hypothetical protein [Defluviicoccus sp.]MDE0274974.1 hypothetical protein [Defluviicoccus sp.]
MADPDPNVETIATDRKWALRIGTIYGDLRIRTHDTVTMQADLIAWLSRNGLLAELRDKRRTEDEIDRRQGASAGG